MTRMTDSAAALVCSGGVLVDRGHDVLRGGLAAEGVGPFFLGGALKEHGRVARVGHGLDDVLALGEQAGVGGGRVEGEQDRTGLQLRDEAFGHDSQDGIRDSEDHDVGALDGLVGGGDFTAFGMDTLLAGGRVLGVEHGVGGLLEVRGNAHPHLASGSDDGDGQLFCWHFICS
jgi:hypothetical protein